jgi:hypothetical protein
MLKVAYLQPVARHGGGLEAEDAGLGLYWEPKQVASAAMVHHADHFAAGVRAAMPDEKADVGVKAGVHVDGRMGLETYEEAECSRREGAAAGRGVGSAAW